MLIPQGKTRPRQPVKLTFETMFMSGCSRAAPSARQSRGMIRPRWADKSSGRCGLQRRGQDSLRLVLERKSRERTLAHSAIWG